MPDQFPAIEPYERGLLDVGERHRIYWECCGNPTGKPALFLHGGPGSGCSVGQRRFFNPTIYRAVLFDQRGSGRSRPLASDEDADLHTNTTAHLISDIEILREHLGVERWTILGLSWGTTLGLAYAEAHPERVSAMVLALVTTTSRREVQWATEGRVFRSSGNGSLTRSPTACGICGWSMPMLLYSPIPTPRFRIMRLASGVPGRTRTSLFLQA